MRSAPTALLTTLCLVTLAAGCRKSEPIAPGPANPAPEAAPPALAPIPAPPAVAGRVEVAVTEQGFVPERIPAKKGVPITLAITRKTDKTCATEILFQGQAGKTDLPLNKTVDVAYTPGASGDIKFGCAMGMMIGGVLAVGE